MNNKKTIYIGSRTSDRKVTGRENLSRSILAVVERVNEDIKRHNIERIDTNPFTKYVLGSAGYVDGLNFKEITRICERIYREKIQSVIIDGSNFGPLARAIKKTCPSCTVITFFHNCEYKFFLDSLYVKKNPKSFFVLIANYLAERSACRFSDVIVCLTKADSQNLQNYYGRGADFILPIFLSDNTQTPSSTRPVRKPYCLFVGGAFYANLESANWLSSKLADRLSIDIVIVGQGMEKYMSDLKQKNVHVFGEVKSLASFYHHAEFVVAPIFSGSGMKTKVAEALKFGKFVIGSRQAFIGYEALNNEFGMVANTLIEYVELSEAYMKGKIHFEPSHARNAFYQHYSETSAVSKFETILLCDIDQWGSKK